MTMASLQSAGTPAVSVLAQHVSDHLSVVSDHFQIAFHRYFLHAEKMLRFVVVSIR